jgi:hypothetical protein
MRRRLFAVASAVSLLLCLVSVGLWVRSYRSPPDYLVWTVSRDQQSMLVSQHGEIQFVAEVSFDPRPRGEIRNRSGPVPVWYYAIAFTSTLPVPLLWLGFCIRRVFRPSLAVSRGGSVSFTLAMICMILATATALLWIRSRWSFDRLKYQNPDGILWVQSIRGEVGVLWMDASKLVATSFWDWETHSGTSLAKIEQGRRVDLSRGYSPAFPGVMTATGPGHRAVVVRLWLLLILTLAFPAVWVVALILRRVPRGKSLCPSCGYNLTGNTSGVCPECGTPVPKEPAEKSPRTA